MKKKQQIKQHKTLKVTQTRSSIGRDKIQKKHLLSLGLTKIGQTKIIKLSNSTEGLIKKINHLIKTEEMKWNVK